jgi:hypothetical protein
MHRHDGTNRQKLQFAKEMGRRQCNDAAIDHQIGIISRTHSHDVEEVKKNALLLPKIATAVDMALILTSSMEEHVQDRLMPELEDNRAQSVRCSHQARGHRQRYARRGLQQLRQGNKTEEDGCCWSHDRGLHRIPRPPIAGGELRCAR